MAVAFFLCAAVIGVILWVRENAENGEDPGNDTGTMQEEYVQDCQEAGHAEADCEVSWSNDTSSTWTGYLYSDVIETTESIEDIQTTEDAETGGTEVSDQYDAYIEECQYDGYSESECDTSWYADTSYTWTGVLYGAERSQYEVYMEECQAAGYHESECDTSWYADPSYTWTGELFY